MFFLRFWFYLCFHQEGPWSLRGNAKTGATFPAHKKKPQPAIRRGRREGGLRWVQNVGLGIKCMGAAFGSCWASVGWVGFECWPRWFRVFFENVRACFRWAPAHSTSIIKRQCKDRGHISRPHQKPQSTIRGEAGRAGQDGYRTFGLGVKCMGATLGSCWASVGRGGFECFMRIFILVSGEPLLFHIYH